MRQENLSVERFASKPSRSVLLGFSVFVACAVAPLLARADGAEVVTGVAPATPPPLPPETSPPTAAPRRTTEIAAFVLGGVAVAGAGAGIAFGVLALNDKSSFDAHPTFHTGNLASENAVLSDVCLGGAVVAAVTSVVLFVRLYQTPPDAAAGSHGPSSPLPRASSAVTFTLSPMFTPHGGGAGASLRF